MKEIIFLILGLSLLTGCAYKGAIDGDFYQSSNSFPRKISANVTFHRLHSQHLEFKSYGNSNEGDYRIDISKGINNALEKLIDDYFQDDPATEQKYLLKANVECNVDFANNLETTVFLSLHDGISGQLIRQYSISKEASLHSNSTAEVLIAGTYLCLFIPSPITLPLAAKIYGNNREALIEENLTASMDDLSYHLYRDRSLLEQRAPTSPSKSAARASSTGSGFFVTGNGYLLTDSDQIEGASKIVVMHEGQSYPAVLVKRNTESNLALLKCKGEFPYMSITDQDSPIGKFLSGVDGMELDDPGEAFSELALNRAKKASVKIICY